VPSLRHAHKYIDTISKCINNADDVDEEDEKDEDDDDDKDGDDITTLIKERHNI
jgi:hypothetical protein